MAAPKDRWTWVGLAFVFGLVLGGLLLWPGSFGGSGLDGIPTTPVPGRASFENLGTVAVRIQLDVQDRQGRVLQQEQLVVAPGENRQVGVDQPEGTYLLVGTFRLDVGPTPVSKVDFYLDIGRCGEERTSGVLFRFAGRRTGVEFASTTEECA